jgi:hypothetical protein
MKKQNIIDKSNQKEIWSQIPYEYKVGLQKLSTPRIGSYPITNVHKNGTIIIQKVNVSEILNTSGINLFNQKHS